MSNARNGAHETHILIQQTHDSHYLQLIAEIQARHGPGQVTVARDHEFPDVVIQHLRSISAFLFFHPTAAANRALNTLRFVRNRPHPLSTVHITRSPTPVPAHVAQHAPDALNDIQESLHSPLLPEILVVEDDPVICQVLDNVMRQLFRPEIHTHAQAAIDSTARKRYAAAWIDLMLPDALDGHDVIDHLVEHSPDTAIIVASAKNTDGDRARTSLQGSWQFIEKPFHDAAQLPVILGQAIEAHRHPPHFSTRPLGGLSSRVSPAL